MLNKLYQSNAKAWTLFLVLIMLGLLFVPVQAGEGGDTPEAVFKAAQAAGAKKDFQALSKLVAPSQHAMLAFGTDMGVGMFVEFYEGEKAEELKKKYQAVQDKYGVKLEEEDDSEKLHVTENTTEEEMNAHMLKRAKKLYGHVDATKYVPDLMAIVVKMPEMAEQPFFPYEKLTDLKIEGDRAVGKSDDKEITFLREGGRWYLTADIMD